MKPPRSACPHCNARKHPQNRTCGFDPCKEADAARRPRRSPLLPVPGVHPSDLGKMKRRTGADGQIFAD